MKRILLFSSIILGVTAFGSYDYANAEEVKVTDQGQSTPTEVKIKDADDNGEDPLDPEDKNQTHLTLESVPKKYEFETAVKNKTYSLSSNLSEESIAVFNDRIQRDWTVKAMVTDNSIKRGQDTYQVTSFLVNDKELAKTGADGIVASSATNKTAENNTGNILTPVNSVTIAFSDENNTLKAGDSLSGSVTYQLYATMKAK